jgi:hypothetical protein
MAFDRANDAVLVSCLPLSSGGIASDIRRRGNIPILFGEACLFELTPADVRENWLETRKIRREVASAMVAELGLRLSHSMSDTDDEPETHAGEAAACLFLALHHRDVPLKHALAGCRITWDAARHREDVECLD